MIGLRAATVACLLVCSVFSSVAAQAVRGRIVDELNQQPIVGAWVLLIDRNERAHARALTDATGQFVVRAEAAGEFRLRAILIGYRKWDSEPLPLAVGQTVVQDVTMGLVRVALPALTVEAERTCRVRPAEGELTAALWDEVEKALAATEWTIEKRLSRFRSVSTSRTMDRMLTVLSDSTRRRLGYSDWPFLSIPADSLMDYGFVQPAEDGPVYYGPDAQVLVSDAFLDGHCFRIRRARSDTSTVIGLAFEPVSDRRLPDIRGVLWVDTTTTALQTLEFRYTRLGGWAPAERTGGSIRFASLPSGAWFIREWRARAPIARLRGSRRDTVLFGYLELGGRVVEVFSASGELIVRYEEPAQPQN
jgi:hypothetical protein